MPTPARTDAQKLAVKQRIEAKLAQGFRPPGTAGKDLGAIRTAAAEAVAAGEFRTEQAFVSCANSLAGDFEPDWGLWTPPRYQQPHATYKLIPAPPPVEMARAGQLRHIVAIPDRHRCPRHPHRLEWDTIIWRFLSDVRPDDVVDLGDDLTLDSCSRWDRNDTIAGKVKPTIRADLDHQIEMCQAEERGRAKDYKPRKHKLRGNHNHRLWLYENNNPETQGALTQQYLETLAQFGWREYGFGEILTLSGVGFTHAPFNGMGKPMGGKTATHRAGALLTAPLVHGHTHSFEVHNAAKLGLIDKITVVQAGCALPPGEVEHYAQHSPTGWSYGVVDMWVQDGEILDLSFRSLERLRAIYSDDGADIKRVA
ncbi:hypothetical protein [Phenylobacterium deserti]|uniref:Uncharacterized protein n=1 Tax=Phenylobacterium deserti TaxID=1914756 RepID=A0A328AD50_9CAUL|nr:hypothetical protein [Phenylobacterium deserti]RAK52146.1 hypothetical protein DJ018_13400 [Phenylobacterium deserti]